MRRHSYVREIRCQLWIFTSCIAAVLVFLHSLNVYIDPDYESAGSAYSLAVWRKRDWQSLEVFRDLD